MILLWLWLAAIVSVAAAYGIAGDIWKQRHSIFFGVSGKRLRMSGLFGEIFIGSATAAFLYLIDRVTETVSLSSLVTSHPMISLAAMIIVVICVYAHGIMTALSADEGEKGRLFLTYMAYSIFCVLLFLGLAVLAGLMVAEAIADADMFSSEAQRVIGQFTAASGLPAPEMTTAVNMAYLDAQSVLARLETSMSPVFVFAAGIFALNLLIRYTPLRAVFVTNAVLITYASTFTALALVLGTGIWVYTGQYSVFIETVLDALATLRSDYETAAPEYSSRFADIWMKLTQEQALLGFLSRMSDEWGGVAALLGVIHWGAERFSGKARVGEALNEQAGRA